MVMNKLNLFAFVVDEGNRIRRIPISATLQDEITKFILKQKEAFYTDQTKVDFSGRYNADVGEIFRIKNYPLDKEIIAAIENPSNYNILDLRIENHRIVALFAGIWSNNEKYVCFQVFDSRKIISKGFTILLSGDCYTKLENPCLTLQDKLTALHQGNELLFYSYYNTRRFLDLNDYYKEATDTDLVNFISQDLLYPENGEKLIFIKNADSIVRKKVALLQRNNVLGGVTIDDIKKAAKDYNIPIKTKNGQIIIPSDKKDLKELLRFLDEDYFTAILTKRKCLTNSKEYL